MTKREKTMVAVALVLLLLSVVYLFFCGFDTPEKYSRTVDDLEGKAAYEALQ
jgi:type II secretory pathway component PulM